MKKEIRFGIIGCGTISNWHADAIAEIEGATLVGVTDVYEPARIAFAEKRGVKISRSQMQALIKALNHYRRNHPDWVLAEVSGAKGEYVIVKI